MNKLLLLLSFGFFCHEVYSQEHSIGQYTTIYSDQFLDIEAAEGVFTDVSTNKSHQRYFLKYTNKTSEDITFSFVRSTEYQSDCTSCPSSLSESIFNIDIQANEIKEFSSKNSDKRFYIFVKDNNNWIKNQLISFEITTIQYNLK
ncbi:MAG: hypothetical protein P8O07_01750 [Crocinitomicaceae bacterium]|nr:hypothetical protein [Crocinitomicaceae bacterium]